MILHLFKNDLRYLLGWLFAWGGLLILLVLMMCGLRTSLGWNIGYWDFLRYGVLLGFLVQVLFQLLLMVKCVQKENLQSVQSYWLTRPIGGGYLVAAKLLFWLLLIALPQLIQCALIGMIFPGGLEGALRGMGSVSLLALVLGFFAVLAGSVAKHAGQAILLTFGAPFCLLIAGHLALRGFGLAMPVERLLYSLSVVPYLQGVVLVVAFLAGLALYGRQMYHPANRWRYRAACVGVLALLMIATKFPALRAVPESTMQLPEGAVLELSRVRFTRTDRPLPGSRSQSSGDSIQLWRNGRTASDYGIQARCEWHGLPDGWLHRSESVRSYDSEGRWLRSRDKQKLSSYNQKSYGAEYIRTLFPDAPVEEHVRRGGSFQLFSSPLVRAAEVEPTDTFTTIFVTRFYSSEKKRLALSREAKINLGETRLRLRSMDRRGKEVVLKFNFLGVGKLGRELSDNLDGGFLALRDPVSGRVILGHSQSGNSLSAFGLLTAGIFEVSFRDITAAANVIDDLELYYLKQNMIGSYVGPIQYTLESE